MWLGLKSRSRRVIIMWVELLLVSLLCSWRLFSGYTGFLLSSKTISKFQFDKEPLSGCATSKSLNKTCKSLFLFIHFKIDLKDQNWQGSFFTAVAFFSIIPATKTLTLSGLSLKPTPRIVIKVPP